MGSKNVTLSIPSILVLMLACLASSDLAQDRAECANQLASLATCLPYVGGQAKAPTLDCCSGLKQVLDKSKKCLCILIKDRDDPNLGLKINATLAATLPSSCHAPANVTECINLLHLSPSSPDAKVFAGFANLTNMSNSSPAATSGDATASSSRSSASSADGSAKVWIGLEIICAFLVCVFASSSVIW
uniref:Bifunctional inhibitor/plant lipid transfer protein/seed storage helical domain-containing protein n=1 Tax=Rhizophora mucronata TaxID=61149 RepID=A0A2P2QUN7_RHIMU